MFREEQTIVEGHVFTTGYSVESVLGDLDLRLADDHSAFRYVDSRHETSPGYDEKRYKVTITVEKV